MKEDGKVNGSDGHCVYFVKLSMSVYSGARDTLDCVSHDSFLQSHRMLSLEACLGPVALFFKLKDNLDMFKDVEGHVVHLTLNIPINLYSGQYI